ncbi:umps-1, partial [Pristionchus pacificus]
SLQMPLTLVEPAAAGLRNALRLMTEYGVFKLGEFTLKSGQRSPIYIDLRESFGHPDLMRVMCESMQELIEKVEKTKPYKGIVGVPYAALPYASIISQYTSQPLLIIRKEAKSYGTKKLIEGSYSEGQRVIVVEDVVTTGQSLKDVITTLRKDGLVVEDVFCILDRDQGGPKNLEELGVNLHSLLNMEKVLAFLSAVGRLSLDQFNDIVNALNLPYKELKKIDVKWEMEETHTNGNANGDNKENSKIRVRLSLQQREKLATCPVSKRLFSLMHTKATNLCLAIDYEEGERILELADKAGPFVCAVKVHADTIDEFNESWTSKLVALANKHDFLIFEDRKFADTGNTLSMQVKRNAASWADIVTVYGIAGEKSIRSAFQPIIADPSTRLKGILLIAQLSCEGNLCDTEYTNGTRRIAEANQDIVCGFITQEKISDKLGLIHWTPGVSLDETTDGKGQQWRSVEKAIMEQQNDIVIVGRAICNKTTPASELRRYRDAAWEALSAAMPKH